MEYRYNKTVFAPALVAELGAALGDSLDSVAVREGEVVVYLRERVPADAETLVDAVVAAHQPGASNTEKRLEARETARVTLTTTDFRELLARFDAAKDLTEVKVVLRETFVLMLKAAVAADVAAPDVLTALSE